MINGTLPTAQASAASEGNSVSSLKGVMGKDDFMKLLVAQMSAQDPLDPMDNSDFGAQLAQFSALEQMQNVNDSIQELVALQATVNSNMAISLIDKAITAPGNALSLSGGKADSISYVLAANASAVTVSIFDSANNLVATQVKGAQTGGTHESTWDGKDLNGNIVQDGEYTFSVKAKGELGNPISTKTQQMNRVTGVVFEDGVSYAIAGNNKIDVNNIYSISSTL